MLRTRIVTAAILLIVFTAVVFMLDSRQFSWVVFTVVAVAAWEWGRLSYPADRILQMCYAIVFCIVLLFLFRTLRDFFSTVIISGVAVWCISPLLLRLWARRSSVSRVAPLVGLMILLPACLAIVELRIMGPENGEVFFLWSLLLLVWSADIGAYFVGKAVGRHKLAPAISPGKTWEGFGGGLLAAVIMAFVLRALYPLESELPLVPWVFVCLVTALFSVFGDLMESVFKRMAGVKDSGAVLPGHGGILDRIDGVMAAAPVFVVLVSCLQLPGIRELG